MFQRIPENWKEVLSPTLEDPKVQELDSWLKSKPQIAKVFPPDALVFEALRLTPCASVRVVVLGQDPYATAGYAHGLAFSVPVGVKPPPSLRIILDELARDKPSCDQALTAEPRADEGYLAPWARQGVLLLNTVLTVRAGQPGSHAGKRGPGWERLTSAIIDAVANRSEHAVFLLWGSKAIAVGTDIDRSLHTVITSTHPSSRSAYRESQVAQPFAGSSPFSRANDALRAHGQPCIDWRLEQPSRRSPSERSGRQ